MIKIVTCIAQISLVKLPSSRLDGDDGTDGAALHQDVLHRVVLDVLRAYTDFHVLRQRPEKEGSMSA